MITGCHADCVVIGAPWVSMISNRVEERERCRYLLTDRVILVVWHDRGRDCFVVDMKIERLE